MRSFARRIIPLAVIVLAACNDPAHFRPARGTPDYPSVSAAFRVHEAAGCTSIGFVTHGASVDDVAVTVAAHGGTHYKILDDFGGTRVDTEIVGNQNFASGTSRAVKEHAFTAEAFRCTAGS